LYIIYFVKNTYIYRAKIINICENKTYHRIKPMPLTDNETDNLEKVTSQKFIINKRFEREKIQDSNTLKMSFLSILETCNACI
jgi:hypothetical protein